MPFSPLPKTFLDLVAAFGPEAAVVDLGCGQGAFAELLQAPRFVVFGLDIAAWENSGPVSIVADACALPLRRNRLDLLLAGNLVRHLLAQEGTGRWLVDWFGALRSGGAVFICEDAPGPGCAAVENYHRVQELLARALPERRGRLLTLERFQGLVARLGLPGRWSFGQEANRYPADGSRMVAFLRKARQPAPRGETADLIRALERHGLSYGDFWWACGEKET